MSRFLFYLLGTRVGWDFSVELRCLAPELAGSWFFYEAQRLNYIVIKWKCTSLVSRPIVVHDIGLVSSFTIW